MPDYTSHPNAVIAEGLWQTPALRRKRRCHGEASSEKTYTHRAYLCRVFPTTHVSDIAPAQEPGAPATMAPKHRLYSLRDDGALIPRPCMFCGRPTLYICVCYEAPLCMGGVDNPAYRPPECAAVEERELRAAGA